MATLTSGSGNDTLAGSGVSDTYVFLDGFGTDSITEAFGSPDIVDLSAVIANLTINLTASITGGVNEITDGTNTVNWTTGGASTIEYAIGGSGNDVISGNSSANSLTGGGGNDTIDGGTGNDTLDGGAGNDTYKFIGSFGTDSISADASGTDTVDLFGVVASLTINLNSSGTNDVDGGTVSYRINWATDFIENVIGGSNSDTIYGNDSANSLTSGGGKDTMDGGSGNDTFIISPGGIATINDASGTDTLDFSARTDILDINLSNGTGSTTQEFQINSYTPNNQLYSSVAALNDGGFVVTWDSYGQDVASTWGIYGQRYNSSGTTVGSEFQINSYTTSHQTISSVAALNDGGFVVTWHSSGQDGNGYGVYGQRYNSSGTTVGSEFQINSYTTNDQKYPSVAALNDGGFVVTWHSSGQDGNVNGVYGQRYNSSGTTVGSEFQINSYTTSNQTISSVAALNDGGFVVTWESYGQDVASTWGIYGQRYNSSGTTVGTEFPINSYTTSDQVYPSVAALNDGGFVVTWASNLQEGSLYGVYGQRYNSSGTTVGSEFQINSYTTSSQTLPSVAALNDGGFVVTWESYQDGSSYGVYGQRYNSSGTTVGSEFQINSYTANQQQNSSVAALNDGGFVVTWHSYQDGDSYGVYGQRYDANGNKVGNITILTVQNNSVENVIGGSGADMLSGDTSANSLTGGTGNDTIDGGGGNDSFDGGTGNDTYKFLAGWGVDQISDDSSGRDTLDFSGMATSVTINLSTNPGADEVTTGTNILNWTGNLLENVTGGSAADKITGNLDSNYVIGNGGDDTMDGDVGSDTYEFSGTWGADSIIDSAGAVDHLILSAVGANLVINLASGGVGDEVTDGTNTVNWDNTVVIEKVTTGSGNDTIYGNSANNLFEAGSGNDSIEGGSGNDSYVFGNSWGDDTIYDSAGVNDAISLRNVTADLVINMKTNGVGDEVTAGVNKINWMSDAIEQVYSGSGNDSITGNSARNVILGGSGNDTMDGDLGNDTYQFSNSWGTDSIIDGGGTDDSVDLSSVTTALTINLGTDGTGDEVTAGGTNTINWTGDVANAIEKAYAGSGSDLIYGSSANNFLSGGGGNDTLYGLSGNDIYVFSTSGGADIINDASGADDKLSLRTFTIGAGPNQATFTAQDFNTDTFVDDLLVSFASGGSVTIKNYFDNSNVDDDLSNPGTGYIETLVFSDDTSVPFAQVQTLIA